MKKLKRPETERQERARGSLRAFKVGEGLPSLTGLHAEIQDYWDVLLGRTEPPVKMRDSTLALMECADAFHARALEIKSLLQMKEAEGRISKGSPHYLFRTGPLQNFIDMARKASDLGSRRLTEVALRTESERRGREHD